MRICVYGGSFNPIHQGHVALARWMIVERHADEVWLMPSPQNPLKPAGSLLGEQERLALARLATAGQEGVRVSDFECSLPRPSYTWHTLQALRAAYPQHEFLLLIGEDNWDVFDRWYRGADIVKNYDVWVYPRHRRPQAEGATLPPRVHWVNMPLIPLSSTRIREQLAAGGFCPEGLDARVYAAICRSGWYGTAAADAAGA